MYFKIEWQNYFILAVGRLGETWWKLAAPTKLTMTCQHSGISPVIQGYLPAPSRKVDLALNWIQTSICKGSTNVWLFFSGLKQNRAPETRETRAPETSCPNIQVPY